MARIRRTVAVLGVVTSLASFVATPSARADIVPANRYEKAAAAGDLDGDGLSDVIVERTSFDGTLLDVHALRGTDGKFLWRYKPEDLPTLGSTTSYAVPGAWVPAAAAGVLVLSGAVSLPLGAIFAVVSPSVGVLTALDRDGAARWRVPIPGVFTGVSYFLTPGARTVVAGVANAVGDATDDILVTAEASANGGLVDGDAGVYVSIVIDGATGAVASVNVIPLVDHRYNSFAKFIPDVSGDGLADVVMLAADDGSSAAAYAFVPQLNGLEPQNTPELHVFAGATGLPLWQVKGALTTSGIPVGDLDGDGRSEVGVGIAATVDAPATLMMLSGASGDELWSRAGRSVAGVGDVDGDGSRDVVVRRDLGGSIVYEAVSGGGTALYTATQPSSHGLEPTTLISDVNSDGVDDLHHGTAVVSGRTGAALWAGQGGRAAGGTGTFDGSGADLVGCNIGSNEAGWDGVNTFDGATGAPLWQRTFGGYGQRCAEGDLDGDGRSEVLYSVVRVVSGILLPGVVALSGVNGSTLWTRGPFFP